MLHVDAEIGDEVGLFDANGITVTDSTGTNPQYGQVLVGSAVWEGDQLNIVATLSIDLSDFGGPILNGAIEGNDIVIKVWDQDQNYVYDALPNYVQGNGTYGEILTVIDILDGYIYGCTDEAALNYDSYANMDDGSCDYTVQQYINLDAYQMNNISFNVGVSDYYSTSDLFGQLDILLAYDDTDDYYVPQFGINQIDLNYSNGYYVFISGADADTLVVEAEPVNVNNSIELMPYMMNNISYLPSDIRYAEDVFGDVSVLLVSNDQGEYYLPSLGVNTLGTMHPGDGYAVFINGGETLELVYGDSTDTDMARLDISESIDYSETITQAYSDVVVPTGISYPVVITDIIGDVSIGDEVVAYADGQIVGATRISDLSAPVVIAAWGGYHDFDIDLEGYAVGDLIDLRLYSQEEGKEMKLNVDLDNMEYGVGVFSSGTIEVMDMLAVPEEYMLSQNYPNPFNPSTMISFSVPSEGHVLVNIYDITGRLISTLVDSNLSSGYHEVSWDGTDMFNSSVSAGLYIYSLQAEGVSLTRKMVLMK